MTQTAEQLKQALRELPAQERADLARFLIHSLDDQEDPEVEEAWGEELQRRTEEIQSGRVVGEAAGAVFTRLREQYG